jgi:hypothetical protein
VYVLEYVRTYVRTLQPFEIAARPKAQRVVLGVLTHRRGKNQLAQKSPAAQHRGPHKSDAMPCPFCGGPVEDENCRKCGSLEGFTSADTDSVVQKPASMIAMSEQWTDRYSMGDSDQLASVKGSRQGGDTDGGEVGTGGAAAAGGNNVADDDADVFEDSCVDNSLRVVDVELDGHTYAISQEMEPDDLAPIFSDVWTGSQVWRCSVVSCKFMSDFFASRVGVVKPPHQNPCGGSGAHGDSSTSSSSGDDVDQLSSLAKLRCIELGSGCGLLPIHAARLGVGCAVATDQTPMVRLARFNIAVRGCACVRVYRSSPPGAALAMAWLTWRVVARTPDRAYSRVIVVIVSVLYCECA